ncbi:hypothetical protein EYC84_005730 [Monilinia fructicola]|uniref:Uncharacterized protein n=1 Tax=Monilinia fructicola TaxID=38448 RepID=A0A5M9K5Z4_MONFR|nr:hypothetical protein EYC84_005730 [Monilinia fructicola]
MTRSIPRNSSHCTPNVSQLVPSVHQPLRLSISYFPSSFHSFVSAGICYVICCDALLAKAAKDRRNTEADPRDHQSNADKRGKESRSS